MDSHEASQVDSQEYGVPAASLPDRLTYPEAASLPKVAKQEGSEARRLLRRDRLAKLRIGNRYGIGGVYGSEAAGRIYNHQLLRCR